MAERPREPGGPGANRASVAGTAGVGLRQPRPAGHAGGGEPPAHAVSRQIHGGVQQLEAAMQQGEAAMEQGEAAVEHDQRETMNPAPLITARLRVDAIPIQLANKVITR